MRPKSLRGVTFVLLVGLLMLPSTSVPVGASVTPQVGSWTGVTGHSQPMSFTVQSSGTRWVDFKLKMTFSTFFCSGWVRIIADGPGSITSGHFSDSGGEGGILGWTFSFTGTFDTASSAHGTYTFHDPLPGGGCLSLSQSGTWTATAAGGPPASATCSGVAATIVGSGAGETRNGTAGPDVIVGLGGDDTIYGRGGNDLICGNGGNNTINSGPGNDQVRGGAGGDYIKGNAGSDILLGEGGDDSLNRGDGTDTVTGGSGYDICYAEAKQSCELP